MDKEKIIKLRDKLNKTLGEDKSNKKEIINKLQLEIRKEGDKTMEEEINVLREELNEKFTEMVMVASSKEKEEEIISNLELINEKLEFINNKSDKGYPEFPKEKLDDIKKAIEYIKIPETKDIKFPEGLSKDSTLKQLTEDWDVISVGRSATGKITQLILVNADFKKTIDITYDRQDRFSGKSVTTENR